MLAEAGNIESFDEEEIGHLKLPKFIESSDQVLYFSDFMADQTNNTSMISRNNIQANILKQSGILLQIGVENKTEQEPEALMHVYSICGYCGQPTKWQHRDLGHWQRNRTQFAKFFHVFDNFHKLSFNNTNLNIGYFNHPPHFSCYADDVTREGNGTSWIDQEIITSCEGVEWEMISQMGKSLDFSVTWTNLSDGSSQGSLGETSNISNMIAHFQDEKIDLAVGGISVTPQRVMYVDFSNVFANDPIVFVVQKKSDLFALGIWLAFNPEIWPLILLLIAIISFLFHIIINQYTLERPRPTNIKGKWALSTYLERHILQAARKPIHVAMFEALEITLQPLLGQPLSTTQITPRPRRLLKLLLTIWWFSCLIISTLYNTSLITSLINPISPKEAEALKDLLVFGYSFKPAGKQGAFFELIKTAMVDEDISDDQVTPPTVSSEEMNTVRLIKQISERLVGDGATPTSSIAYVIEESAVKGIKWYQKEIGFSQIKVIRERLFLTTYAWPVQRHAPFKQKIDTALGRLNAAGLILFWYDDGHKNKEPKSGKFRLRQKLSQINLNMQVLQGAFIFLLFGHGLGAVVLGVEHLTKRYTFRVFTKKQIIGFCKMVYFGIKKVYVRHFAAEHEDLQVRRQKNRMRFRGAVRTLATFKPRAHETTYMK
ncbi:unnamed protein product [Orchesella dallaii]|uniref:Ionotropic glutamate receptor L-glutamate and glycine-binding domain-containing protein n=1 Tax=Orchesella dallaii TaxID=48710 RepID=A0ABP1QEA5_9HEXA